MITRPTYWTLWRVRRMLRSMVDQLKAEENLKPSKQTITFQLLLSRNGLYPEILSRWNKAYGEDEEIHQAISTMKTILEGRIIDGTMRKRFDSFMTMLNLKNNYGWHDDPAADQRDEQRVQIQADETRRRLAEQRRANMLGDGNSTDPDPV